MEQLASEIGSIVVWKLLGIHDGSRGVGVRSRGDAVDNCIIEHLGSGRADIQAGDEQGGFETGVLTGSPGLAGFVSAQTDADDVLGQ